MVNVAKAPDAPVLTLSTDGVAGPHQRDAWEQVVVGLHGQMRFEGAPFERYQGTLAARQSNALQFVAFDAAAAASSRTAAQAASDAICRVTGFRGSVRSRTITGSAMPSGRVWRLPPVVRNVTMLPSRDREGEMHVAVAGVPATPSSREINWTELASGGAR